MADRRAPRSGREPSDPPGLCVEPTDVIDPTTGTVVETRPRHEVHAGGLWHRTTHVWVVMRASSYFGTPDGLPGDWLLFQRHPAHKRIGPYLLGASAAGHLRAGETPADAVRELREELGIAVEPEALLPVLVRPIERRVGTVVDREEQHVFGLVVDFDWTIFRFDVAEVLSLAAFRLEDLEAMLEGERPRAEGFALIPIGLYDRTVMPVSVPRSGFLDQDTGYLAQVVAWARRLPADNGPALIDEAWFAVDEDPGDWEGGGGAAS